MRWTHCLTVLILTVLMLLAAVPSTRAEQPAAAPDRDVVAASLRKAVAFFQQQVSVEGGYLWRYSADLEYREGEGRATNTMAWVQPPGTPSVAAALLDAYRLTGDPFYLDAARQSAGALVRGQLQSGGWDYRIEFDPELRRRYAYRVDGNPRGNNVSTLDDDTTQAALRSLMEIDQALEFKDEAIHEAAMYALDALTKTQYPNGAWPQRFSEFPDPDQYPVKPASYPENWSREHPRDDYRDYYTFNDNTIADTIDTMFLAARIYGDVRYRQSAERGGDFILLAQMPEPQPAWAQQYNAQMHPAWARRFEPPAITGGESQGVLRILLTLYRQTGDKKYLQPIPPAIAYLKKSQLPDGRLARFYELRTNRPLYFTKQYELTYSDDDMPTHYAFKVRSRLETIEREYQRLLESGPDRPTDAPRTAAVRLTPALVDQAQSVLAALDDRGAWVEAGQLRYHDAPQVDRIVDSRTFASNVRVLARYLAATKP